MGFYQRIHPDQIQTVRGLERCREVSTDPAQRSLVCGHYKRDGQGFGAGAGRGRRRWELGGSRHPRRQGLPPAELTCGGRASGQRILGRIRPPDWSIARSIVSGPKRVNRPVPSGPGFPAGGPTHVQLDPRPPPKPGPSGARGGGGGTGRVRLAGNARVQPGAGRAALGASGKGRARAGQARPRQGRWRRVTDRPPGPSWRA